MGFKGDMVIRRHRWFFRSLFFSLLVNRKGRGRRVLLLR